MNLYPISMMPGCRFHDCPDRDSRPPIPDRHHLTAAGVPPIILNS